MPAILAYSAAFAASLAGEWVTSRNKTALLSQGGFVYRVEDRVRTGDLWNHNPAL